jgi:hypothetical protein
MNYNRKKIFEKSHENLTKYMNECSFHPSVNKISSLIVDLKKKEN